MNNPLVAVGGITIVGLGVFGAVDPDRVGSVWFAVTVVASVLLAKGTYDLAHEHRSVARRAFQVASAGFVAFAAAHVLAIFDDGPAIPLFSVFLVVISVALIVAGVVLLRAGGARVASASLAAGVWPLATVPAGAALGDVPHFLAIAGWGVSLAVLGLVTQSQRSLALAA